MGLNLVLVLSTLSLTIPTIDVITILPNSEQHRLFDLRLQILYV